MSKLVIGLAAFILLAAGGALSGNALTDSSPGVTTTSTTTPGTTHQRRYDHVHFDPRDVSRGLRHRGVRYCVSRWPSPTVSSRTSCSWT
jgi:hypothetical protein